MATLRNSRSPHMFSTSQLTNWRNSASKELRPTNVVCQGYFLRNTVFHEGGKQARFAVKITVNQAFCTACGGCDLAGCSPLVTLAGKQFQSCDDQCLLLAGTVPGSRRPGCVRVKVGWGNS